MHKLQDLLQQGVLGFYNTVEVTEIFAISPNKRACNVFTIIVAEESIESQSPLLLNDKLITIKGLRNWSFGIQQYSKSLSDILLDIELLTQKQAWMASGQDLLISSELKYASYRFIPSDGTFNVPINKILKNNFDNGSYIFEWFDYAKKELNDLLRSPRYLQELSLKIQEYIPIQLSSISEQVGNIIFQIPVSIVVIKFQERQDNSLIADIDWHNKATKRPLLLNIKKSHDDTILFYHSHSISVEDSHALIKLPNSEASKGYNYVVWDCEHQITLGAINYLSFVNQISFKFSRVSGKRFFHVKGKKIEISIQSLDRSSVNPYNLDLENEKINWISKRIYKEEKDKLIQQKKFIQYGKNSDDIESVHQQALNDLHWLIDTYGEKAVWLWDPFLTVNDIVDTLFYTPYLGSELKALTHQKNHYSSKIDSFPPDEIQSNNYGLNLEFRTTRVNRQSFHDRFLIFPKTDNGAKAWSLGTSVNSFGKSHHILHEVSHPQLIVDAFSEIWDSLDRPENILWKI